MIKLINVNEKIQVEFKKKDIENLIKKFRKTKTITPIRSYIDTDGNWQIEFNKKDIKKFFK